MQLNTVDFWVNAFIPNSVCEQRGEFYVVASPPVPLPRFFTGDQRDFSNDVAASARMHAQVRIERLSTDSPSISSQKNFCGESHEVDSDGVVIASATADSSRIFFTNLRGSQTVDPEGGVVDGIPGSIQIDVQGSAGMPLLAGSPDIDFSGTLTIDRDEGNVLFRGDVSQFPAFKIYIRVNDDSVGTLAQLIPLVPMDLFGQENRHVDVSTRLVL